VVVAEPAVLLVLALLLVATGDGGGAFAD